MLNNLNTRAFILLFPGLKITVHGNSDNNLESHSISEGKTNGQVFWPGGGGMVFLSKETYSESFSGLLVEMAELQKTVHLECSSCYGPT
jgi:hypothetical protein